MPSLTPTRQGQVLYKQVLKVFYAKIVFKIRKEKVFFKKIATEFIFLKSFAFSKGDTIDLAFFLVS